MDLWARAQALFVRNPDGSFLFDPADETTPFTDLVDMESLSLWRATEAAEKTPGKKRARVEMIDARGERLIQFVEGQDAEAILARAGMLERSPALRRIYEKTGAAGILRGLLDAREPAAPQPKK